MTMVTGAEIADTDESSLLTISTPLRLKGEVVRGFGRGSRELGIPTANFPQSVVDSSECAERQNGIYFGWAQVKYTTEPSTIAGINEPSVTSSHKSPINGECADRSQLEAVYPMVMSIGWNPYYKNEKRTAEVHIINYPEGQDFYGQHLSVVVLGYLRPERDFKSVDELIHAIHEDIRLAQQQLQQPSYIKFKTADPVFTAV